MAPHSSTLAWKIPWMEEPGRLQPMGSLRVGHDWATSLSLFTFMHWRRKWQTHSSVLAWRIPGTEEPGGLPSMGPHRVRHDWSDLAATVAANISDLFSKSSCSRISRTISRKLQPGSWLYSFTQPTFTDYLNYVPDTELDPRKKIRKWIQSN